MANYKVLTRAELRGFKKPKRLFIAAISAIIAFYTLPYILYIIMIPDILWLRIGLSGIISFVAAEAID